MKISGFSFVRNGDKLYYPVVESIQSILPICDEFIVAVGDCDDDDKTLELIKAIDSNKIRIIQTKWTDRDKLKGKIHSQQTNIALKECTGDWCFYVQSDEVVHENDLPAIKQRCEELLEDKDVEGLLFKYNHFWGDYNHVHRNHAWYPNEIRIIKNNRNIISWNTAQSFRKSDGSKIKATYVNAEIFHYGWVRPPQLMQNKRAEFGRTHLGLKKQLKMFEDEKTKYNYGSLENISVFRGTHPKVMQPRISQFNWGDKLQYEGKSSMMHQHNKFKYKFLSFIEYVIFGGKVHLGAKKWSLIRR